MSELHLSCCAANPHLCLMICGFLKKGTLPHITNALHVRLAEWPLEADSSSELCGFGQAIYPLCASVYLPIERR